MRVTQKRLTAALVLLLTVVLPAEAGDQLRTVPGLDLDRYMGRWHQIALLPNRFQASCVGETTAEYKFIRRNRVEVVNQCRDAEGVMRSAAGAVRRNADFDDPARLEVRFAPAWLSPLSAVWGDYWVIDIDDEYSAAMVGSPDREYLWILAREPSITATTYERFVRLAASEGFAVSRLERERGSRISGEVP